MTKGSLRRSFVLLLILLPSVTAVRAYGAETRITTAVGRGADSEVRLNHNDIRDLPTGEDVFLAVRFSPTRDGERNEMGYLRFDLTGVDPAKIVNSRLELTRYSATTKNNFVIYGLKHTAENQLWDEAEAFKGAVPGLLKNVTDWTSRRLDETQMVKLGSMAVPSGDAETSVRFTSKNLTQFLQDAAWCTRTKDPNLVTIILTLEKNSDGRRCICTNEFEDEDDAKAPTLILLTR